jgi:hypothetical protein
MLWVMLDEIRYLIFFKLLLAPALFSSREITMLRLYVDYQISVCCLSVHVVKRQAVSQIIVLVCGAG